MAVFRHGPPRFRVVIGFLQRHGFVHMNAARHSTGLGWRQAFGPVDAVGVEERVAKYTTRSIKKASKLWGLRSAVSMVDLTTLEGKDTPGKVASLCRKALRPHEGEDIPPVAAVCVYPAMVRHARRHVRGTSVKVASVATAFPSGQAPLRTRQIGRAHV